MTLEEEFVTEPEVDPADQRAMLCEKLSKKNPRLYSMIENKLNDIPMDLLDALANKKHVQIQELVENGIPLNRHQQREVALSSLYQHFLVGKDIRRSVYDNMFGSNQIDGYLYSLTMGTVENAEAFKALMAPMLRSDWGWDRLPLIVQCILLMSAQEILENETEKSVVINEALTLLHQYHDDSMKPVVNAVLDQLQ